MYVCVRVCVYAFQCSSLYVCQAAELRDEDSSLTMSAQMLGDISVCLLPQSKTVIFYALFKGTQMKWEEEMHFFPREELSEVNKGQREKQKKNACTL